MKYDNVLSDEMRKCPNEKIIVLQHDIIVLSFNKRRNYEKGCVNIERTRKIYCY